MLQLLSGRSGSGKTELIFNRIAEEADKGDIVLLIPEQSSYQCEKRILDMLGAEKASRVSVMSFKRMYDIVTEEYGSRDSKRIDDGVKAVLMSTAAEQISDRLVLYAGRYKKSDFAELMTDAVNEFKACAVTPDDLYNAAERTHDERLRQKLRESADVYSAYDALLGSSYSDPSDDLTRLYELLCENPFFEDRTVFIDAFNGFSGQEMRIVGKIIEQADEVVVSLCCDGFSADGTADSIFSEPEMTGRKLIAAAENCGAAVAAPIKLRKAVRYKSPSIAAIEESVFRFDGDPYYAEDDSVQIYEADDEYDEIRQICREISGLVRYKGCRYNEITVIMRDPTMFSNIISSEFPKYDIPFFMSEPKPLDEKPLIRLILSAFEAVHSSFNTESILTMLKTEMTPVRNDDIYRLENYVYMWDIKGVRWKQPFTMNPEGNTKDINTEELLRLEKLRQCIIAPLIDFSEELGRAANGADISEAVYSLLIRLEADKSMKRFVSLFDKPSELRQRQTEAAVWDTAMDILDKMHNILSSVKTDSKRYYELLKLMIRKSPISDIPQTLDSVVIGTAGNIRAQGQKAVFIIGALEGVFPAVPKASGVFSDNEREQLIGLDLPLGDTAYALSLREKFNAYAALSLPSERLYISRYLTPTQGGHCESSVIIKEILNILKDTPVKRHSSLRPEELFYTERQAFEECAALWRDNTGVSAALREYFSSAPDYSSRYKAISGMLENRPFLITGRYRTKRLFGEKLSLSATQAENYYLCPFRYFCRYGLKAYPRKRAVMDAGMYGGAVHFILEGLLRDEPFDKLSKYSSAELSGLIRKYTALYIEEIGGEGERTERFFMQFSIIERNVSVLLKRLIDEFSVCSFVPSDFELEIGTDGAVPGYELELPTGERITVSGKVDRVDTYDHDGKRYIRIIDYKTGTKDFKLSDVLYGLNIQMLLYLSILNKTGEEHFSKDKRLPLAPAGILYMPATPSAKTGIYESDSQRSEAEKAQLSSFKMNGLLLDDAEVIAAMETDGKGIYIPVRADGKNGIRADNCLASLETYGRIFSYIDKKLISMAQSLYDGDIKRYPVKGGSADACKYCDYKSVCGYEEGKPFNQKTAVSHKEAIEIINSEEGDDNG